MKNTKLLGLLIAIMIYSCDKSDEFQIQRVIVNASSVDISIRSYDHFIGNEEFTIAANTTNTQQTVCKVGPFDEHCDLIWNRSDSVVVIFNQQRKLRFCDSIAFPGCYIGGGGERSLRMIPYTGAEVEDAFGWQTERSGNDITHAYVITQDDYENAEPLVN